jgi:hypothetical protein
MERGVLRSASVALVALAALLTGSSLGVAQSFAVVGNDESGAQGPVTPGPWTRQTSPPLGGRIDSIAPIPGQPNQLAIASPGGGVWSTISTGSPWFEYNTGLKDLNVDGSNDGCASFNPLAIGPLPGTAVPYSLYLDSRGSIYVGTSNGTYISTFGSAWAAFGLNTGIIPLAITSSPVNSPYTTGTMFAATTSGLYRRLPGQGWVNTNAGGSALPWSDVVVDPVCAKHIFAAQGYASTLAQTGGGVYESTDDGTTWTLLTSGSDLQYSPIASLTIDTTPVLCGASCRHLWAATYGLGTWRYDTGSTSCP